MSPCRGLRDLIQNILNSDDAVYGKQLEKLIAEQQATLKGSDVRPLAGHEGVDRRPAARFRDYVFAEIDEDQRKR